MTEPAPTKPLPAGPATRAEADVRAALAAIDGLSLPAGIVIEPPPAPPAERYTRLRLHARGGLGQVWLGRDELVGREVAVKEPRPDRPADAARAALDREAWVLGRLQHPNVVPLYDVVRGTDGRAAFYVMPFLGGDTLHGLADRFHRARPPGPATRLALMPLLAAFVDVCAAIDHAHGRGVWHLDIKGANVTLGPTGAAVVLDWGLARVAEPAAGGPPAGGTPAFMAPEQAESPADRVGPHTDVYGLGALLYLLLTGRPPHPDASARNRDELAAALRRPVTPPADPWPGVPAALAAVCLRALAADPADRYRSPADLRDDVRHWLADEPVGAYRERLPERAARWSRRHRRAAAGAAAGLVLAVAALAAGLVAADRERHEADRQRQAAEAALAREQDSFRQALKAGDDYFTAVSESPLLQAPGQQPLRRELLQRGLAYYRDFLARRGDESALRAEVAAAWHRVGQTHLEIGAQAEAEAAFGRAVALGEDLLAADPANADLRARLAASYFFDSWPARQGGRYADALARLDRAAALAGGLPDGHPQRPVLTARSLTGRSAILAETGDRDGACRAAERAEGWYARAPQDPPTRRARGGNLLFLGLALRDLGRPADAAAAFRKARGVFETLLGEPGLAQVGRDRVAACDNALGLAATDAGDPDRAVAYFEAAHAARRQLVEQNPAVNSYRTDLIATCLNLARLAADRGDFRRAADHAGGACAQADELMSRAPAVFYYSSLAARAYRLAAGYAEAGGEQAAAARLRARSGGLLAGLAAPADRVAWQGVARDAARDGLRQVRWGAWRTAAESFRQAAVCLWRAGSAGHRPAQRASASRQ